MTQPTPDAPEDTRTEIVTTRNDAPANVVEVTQTLYAITTVVDPVTGEPVETRTVLATATRDEPKPGSPLDIRAQNETLRAEIEATLTAVMNGTSSMLVADVIKLLAQYGLVAVALVTNDNSKVIKPGAGA